MTLCITYICSILDDFKDQDDDHDDVISEGNPTSVANETESKEASIRRHWQPQKPRVAAITQN